MGGKEIDDTVRYTQLMSTAQIQDRETCFSDDELLGGKIPHKQTLIVLSKQYLYRRQKHCYQFPKASLTNYRKPGGLTQQIYSQFWRLNNQGIGRTILSLQTRGGHAAMSPRRSLVYRRITVISASIITWLSFSLVSLTLSPSTEDTKAYQIKGPPYSGMTSS